jgi:hypothetical protein
MVTMTGCGAKIFKLIKNNRVIAAEANYSEKTSASFAFFTFVDGRIHPLLMSLKIFAPQPPKE